MSYRNLMQNAAKILFWIAIGIAALSFVTPVLVAFNFGPMASAGGEFQFLAIITGMLGGITSAVPAFAGAAILWRLDIWLFERGDDE